MRYVLDPFRFALERLARLSSAGKPPRAPRVAHAPHAAPAEGIEARARRAEGQMPGDEHGAVYGFRSGPFKLLVAAVFAVCAGLALGSPAEAKMVAVDGDTVRDEYVVRGRLVRGPLTRLKGLDAPETFQPRCRAERLLGLQAKRRLQAILDRQDFDLILDLRQQPGLMEPVPVLDKYRRQLGRLFDGGKDVKDILVSEGLAVYYECPSNRCPVRIDWCVK